MGLSIKQSEFTAPAPGGLNVFRFSEVFFMGMRPNLLGCNSNKPSEGILMTQIIEQFLEVSSTYLLSPCDSDCCHKSAA